MRSRAYTYRDLDSWYRGIEECERKGYMGMVRYYRDMIAWYGPIPATN